MTRAALLMLLCACLPAAYASGSVDDVLEGQDSVYSKWVADVLRQWPATRPPPVDTATPLISCLSTPSDTRYVGTLQQMIINAPLATVENVLDDIANYQNIFKDVVEARVVDGSSNGSHFVTAWEQRIPVFFLPNVKFELVHSVDRTAAGTRAYRYKLRKSGTIIASDGIAVLEAAAPNVTRFTAWDFLNAHWGLLPSWLVWRESLRATFMTDMAIRLRAENPDWNAGRIVAEAMRSTDSEADAFASCIKSRKPVLAP